MYGLIKVFKPNSNIVYAEFTMDTERIEEKIGSSYLEMAAQKAVDHLVSKI